MHTHSVKMTQTGQGTIMNAKWVYQQWSSPAGTLAEQLQNKNGHQATVGQFWLLYRFLVKWPVSDLLPICKESNGLRWWPSWPCFKSPTVCEPIYLPSSLSMMWLSGGALVNTVPTKTWVPHKECWMTLQQPRSSMWKPRWQYLSSVSNSVLLVYGPKNWGETHILPSVSSLLILLIIWFHNFSVDLNSLTASGFDQRTQIYDQVFLKI